MTDDLPDATLADRYARLYTGLLTDVLEDHGLEDQTIHHGVTPLRPSMTTAGVAFPVAGRPNRSVDGDENLRRIVAMMSAAPADAVVTYGTGGSDAAQLGELSVTALDARGCRGAVTDGGVRDAPQILEHGFPVFARHTTPEGSNIRWEVLDWDVTAVVGGVAVEPGDVVVGDLDGVVVVPRRLAADVLEEAEALMEQEDHIRDAVRDGVSPLDAYDEYGSF